MAISNGIYPTMIAAFTEDNKLDFGAMEELIEWYIKNGVHGIFTLCLSTETHMLSYVERKQLLKFVTRTVNGRVKVIASGHVSTDIDEAISEALCLAEYGPDAIVFIRNRLDDNLSDTLKSSIEKVIKAIPPEFPLGIYESPYPYKRPLNDNEFKFIADTGRFAFLKDTVCDIDVMKRRINMVRGTDFKLFNANAATLYDSIKAGYSGNSGIMANFHPDLYVWLYEHFDDPRAELVEKYIGMMSVIEPRCYPICAKRFLKRFEHIKITDGTR